MLRKILTGCVAVGLLMVVVTPAVGQTKAADKPGFSVTVYNQNYALVKDCREIELKKGLSTVKLTDVAATIDATSVRFVSLTDAKGTRVVEQNYEFDLVSADKILQKYIDRPIKIVTKDGKLYEGKLMSFDARQIVLAQEGEGVSMVERGDNIKNILFSKLPEGLLTRPTLVWLIESDRGGKQLVKVSYVARNVKWHTEYSLVIDKDEKLVDMSGWVTIDNKSGTGYKKARIKLLAGDTGNDGRRGRLGWGAEYYKGLSALAPTTEVGAEKGERFSDYYLYRLEEPSTINNKQVKQIELLNATKVPVKKIYVYDGSQLSWSPFSRYSNQRFGTENKKVNVLVEYENRKDRNMGFSLPAGKVRVYKRDDDGSLEFIGEDKIDHTPRDEKVTLYIGDAFDIVGERKQTNWRKVGRTVIESFSIEVKNHKKEEVTVRILEKMCRSQEWRITDKSQDYRKLDSRAVEFPVTIAPNEKKVVTYTVQYEGF